MGRSDETKLEQARRHVCRGQEIIADQRHRIGTIQSRGGEAANAQDLLLLYQDTQNMFEAHLRRVERISAGENMEENAEQPGATLGRQSLSFFVQWNESSIITLLQTRWRRIPNVVR